MILGKPDTRPIELLAHDPAWGARYERERERIASSLGGRAHRIEHVGSTAVPGLAAKPVVDILLAVADPRDAAIAASLEAAGYVLRVDEPDHRLFRTPEADVHLHLWIADSQDVERHLLFRDRLRAYPEDRELYEHVKRRLAARTWPNRNEYAQAKTPVVNAILRRARGAKRGPRIANFAQEILRRLPSAARVLEIGAGEGELAQILENCGCRVVALDPHLRSRFPVREEAFESYDPQGERFECIAAQYVLHHADDLDATLAKIAGLLAPGGFIAIDDYGWERSEDPEFRSERSDLHTSQAMLAALRLRFTELYYADHAFEADGAGPDRLAFTFLGR